MCGNGVGVGRSAVSVADDGDGSDGGGEGGGTSGGVEGMRRDLSRVQRQVEQILTLLLHKEGLRLDDLNFIRRMLRASNSGTPS